MPRRPKSQPSKKEKAALKKTAADTYNEFKSFEGKRYTGMKVGRAHKWYYDQGVWQETKMTPDEWQIHYTTTKRRAGKAPKGSGVPVGTEYHWLIVAHQNVKKLNANDYSTSLMGAKFKLAHKRSENNQWNISEKTQRKHAIELLKKMIQELENEASEGQVIHLPSQKPRVA